MGTGTNFTRSFSVGDRITLRSDQSRMVTEVIDDTNLIIDTPFDSDVAQTVGFGRVGALFNSGYVGIGTTTPASALAVDGRVTITSRSTDYYGLGLDVRKRGNFGGVTESVWQGTELGFHSFMGWDGTKYGRGAYALSVAAENFEVGKHGSKYQIATTALGANDSFVHMTVNPFGNIGIGTEDPHASLHVYKSPTAGTISSAGINIIGNGTLFKNSFSVGDKFVANGELKVITAISDHTNLTINSPYLSDLIAGTSYARVGAIFEAGNVGVGLTNPDQKFVVYNGSTTGSYTTGGWAHSSDLRLKHNIFPIDGALNKILKLRGVEYKFKNDFENKTQLGFIAQEVEPIFPEVVSTDGTGFKSMIYGNLVAPLVESVKTIYKQVVDIQRHNDTQDHQIASLIADNAQKYQTIKILKMKILN